MITTSSKTRLLQLILALVFTGSFVSASFAAADISACIESENENAPIQERRAPIIGDWKIDFTRKEPDQVQLTMVHGTGSRAQNWGKGILDKDLQGLSREQALHSPVDVSLKLTREAGTFNLVGSFRDGKGSGRWTLTPDEAFVSSMRSRGYDNLSESNLFSATMADIRINSIDELKAAGYERLSFEDVIESSIFRITPEFIRDLRAAGFDRLTFRQLVDARIFKIDSAFANQVEATGFGRQPLNKLMDVRIHKVTPEYVNELRSAGLDRLSLSQLIDLKIFKVTPEFINELRAEGFSNVTPQQAIDLRIHKVDRDFIQRARAQGYVNPTLNQLVDLSIHKTVK
jgi:hypothetical protein